MISVLRYQMSQVAHCMADVPLRRLDWNNLTSIMYRHLGGR
jgi:hypothetical protein